MFHIKIPDSSVVKSNVKAVLKDRRIAAGIAGVFPFITYLVLASLYGVFSMTFLGQPIIAFSIVLLVGLFILLPVFLGTIRWFWRISDGLEESPFEVFYYFTSFFLYKRALKCVLFLVFKCAVGFLICLLPYFVVSVISNSWIYQFLGTEVPLWVAGLALVQSFLRLVGIIIGIVVVSGYYLFPILVVMDDNMMLLEAMHASAMVSKRSVGSFIALMLSLTGWVLLSLIIVPIFYTAPILFTAYAVHSRFALVNYNQNLERLKQQQYF